MKSIFKYELVVTDEFNLLIPSGAEFLSVQVQNNKPCLWALVEPRNELRHYRFRCFGTGQGIDQSGLKYLGTTQAVGGSFAWHFFVDSLASSGEEARR
jgi:hypothetical protein